MTANLSSFLRFKFTGKGNEEQDLRGFESTGSMGGAPPGNGNGPTAANGTRGSVAGDPMNKVMDTIQVSGLWAPGAELVGIQLLSGQIPCLRHVLWLGECGKLDIPCL